MTAQRARARGRPARPIPVLTKVLGGPINHLAVHSLPDDVEERSTKASLT
ncbi:hypothetical protein ACGFQG_27545 [Nocardia fluminea]